jgi:hypothetical protein
MLEIERLTQLTLWDCSKVSPATTRSGTCFAGDPHPHAIRLGTRLVATIPLVRPSRLNRLCRGFPPGAAVAGKMFESA